MKELLHSAGLGDSDVGDHDMGEVDLFGLDEWGQPMGMNPVWGAIAGVGVATGATIAVRQITKPRPGQAESTIHKFSELVGGAIGALAGAAMWIFPRTRAAGVAAVASAVVGNGLRQLEISLLSQTPAGATTTQQPSAQPQTTPVQQQPPTTGWGEVSVEPTRLVTMHGSGPFGLVTPEQSAVVTPPMMGDGYGYGYGYGSDASRTELVGPPNLMDNQFGQSPAAAHVRIAGGPPLSELGTHYGHTLFSRG